MPVPSAPARLGDAAGTLKLLAYLAASLVLMVLDHRGGWMREVRTGLTYAIEPLREIAGLPGAVAGTTARNVATVGELARRNAELRRELLLAQARMARMSTLVADNARLRQLLDAAQRGGLDVQLAPILDVDLDPSRQRLVLQAGARQGVRVGQSVIDAHGLLGQVTRVGPLQSDVLLVTDPDHAVPVAVARNGIRLVAYGTGRSDLLALANIPMSSDIRVGDTLVTSGLGARFPPGFAVGRIIALRPDESRAFLRGDVRPAGQVDRGREVLLLRASSGLVPLPPPPPSAGALPGAVLPPGSVPVSPATPSANPAQPATHPASPGVPAAAPAGTHPVGTAPAGTTPGGTAAPPISPTGVPAGVPGMMGLPAAGSPLPVAVPAPPAATAAGSTAVPARAAPSAGRGMPSTAVPTTPRPPATRPAATPVQERR